MAEWQGPVSRRRFLGVLGALTLGTAGLAACGTTSNTPAAATSAATAATAPTASAPAATATPAPIAATPAAAARTTSAAATAAGARTTAPAAAASGGEGDVPNGTYGGSKFFSTVVDQKVDIASVAGAVKWDKAQYTTKAGDVTFVVKNQGPMLHQFGVEGNGIAYESDNLSPNTTTNLTIKGLKSGEYDIACNFGKHRAAGMVAKLMVS